MGTGNRVAASAAEAPATPGTIRPGNFLIVCVQLGLLVLVLRQFQIESGAFLRLAILAFAGFAVHAWLPMRLRLPFFLALSIAGIALVLGPVNAAWVVSIGLALIGLCHVPVSFRARAWLLAGAGILLVAMRASWLPFVWSDAIWPIVGSMFMFRLILYFYDLRHDQAPVSPTRTLSYFFMLPNVCFPLFPVVDYKAFRRNYYDQDAYRTYQIGIDWMVRGVIHLILYRFIYHYVTLAPSEVMGPGDLIRFLVSNFLLYLRISGQFHLIVGMLYLFGFRLPETHHLYYLASSFTDFWRRINIYWKDFMLKVFYYPAYFALRGMGPTRALVLATVFVFFMTWVLHAYQWFWLRGTMLLAWHDALFWAILGALVVVNALWEARHTKERALEKAARGWSSLARLTVKTFATFCFICVLWSFWTADSFSSWLSLWSALGNQVSADAGAFPGLLLAAVIVATTSGGPPARRGPGKRLAAPRTRLRPYLATTVSLVILLAAGIESAHRDLGPTAATVLQTLRSAKLNRTDNAKLERGYYEQLLNVDRFNSQLWEVYAKKPTRWLDAEGVGLKRYTDGFAQNELVPSVTVATSTGAITTNRWGMRDRDYERKPPPGTFRIALLGPSTVMGWGVGDGETFDALLENRLNREPLSAHRHYELLNLAVPGYTPPQELVAFEKALTFEPHAVFYFATGRELTESARYLIQAVQNHIPIPYDDLRRFVEQAGVQATMDETTALKRLDPYRTEILAAIYRRIAVQARERGIVPMLIFLPQVYEGSWQEETPETLRIAEAAGFGVIDLGDVYKNQDIASLRVADWDNHPNARAHALIATRLYETVQEKRLVVFGADPQADAAGSVPLSTHQR